MKMLSADRCDVAAITVEALYGSIIIGDLKMPADIACRKMDERYRF